MLGAAVFSFSVSPTCLAHAAAVNTDEFVFLKTLKSGRNGRYEAPITLQYYTKGSQTLFPCHCCSVAQLCLTLCDPKDCSIPGLPVSHHLLEFAQVHVHCASDATQTSHPLMPSSPSAFNLSQHQRLFQWVICSYQMTKILELQFHHQFSSEYSELISLKIDGLIFLLSKGLSGVFSSTTVQKTFCLLYGPALTTIHDHWLDRSLVFSPKGSPTCSTLNLPPLLPTVAASSLWQDSLITGKSVQYPGITQHKVKSWLSARKKGRPKKGRPRERKTYCFQGSAYKVHMKVSITLKTLAARARMVEGTSYLLEWCRVQRGSCPKKNPGGCKAPAPGSDYKGHLTLCDPEQIRVLLCFKRKITTMAPTP